MPDTIREFEPILPYPSRQSVIDLTLATIERNSNAALPDDWPENEPLYLQENDVTTSSILQEILDDAIRGAEPSPWLLQDLKEFEQTLVEYVIEGLEKTAEGRTFLNAMRASANWQSWAQRRREYIPDDAQ